MNKIFAGDTVFHKPTGETWVVCGINEERNKLIPCGYPFPSIGNIDDCDLIEKGKRQSEEMKNALRKHGLTSFIEVEVENE